MVVWDIIGTTSIFMNLTGVILLFVFGMPFRVSNPSAKQPLQWFVSDDVDPREAAKEKRFRRSGYVGLLLIVAGSALQVFILWAM